MASTSVRRPASTSCCIEEVFTAVARATAVNTSSMQQDVLAGRRTEVDAILGAALDRAGAHGVPVPTLRTLADLLRAWERARDLR